MIHPRRSAVLGAASAIAFATVTGCRSGMHVPLPITPERAAVVADVVESHRVTLRMTSGYRCRATGVEVDVDSVRWTGPDGSGAAVPWADVAAIETRETARGAGEGVLVGLAAVAAAWAYARLALSYEALYVAVASPLVAVPLGVTFGAGIGHRTTIEVGNAGAGLTPAAGTPAPVPGSPPPRALRPGPPGCPRS